MNTFEELPLWNIPECKELIEFSLTQDWKDATVSRGEKKGISNQALRVCRETFISEQTRPDLCKEVYDIAVQANRDWNFEFDSLDGGGFHVFWYGAGQGHFMPHTDWGGLNAKRKLSITIQLSDSADYEGCEVNLYDGPESPWPCHKGQGVATVFPSWTLHEVTPLISGERYAVVAWVLGRRSYR